MNAIDFSALTLVTEPDSEVTRRVLVTPSIAKDWLEKYGRERNRKLNIHRVREHVALMRANRWMCSGEGSICFMTDQRLGNAHHRLAAVIEYGKPVWFIVRYNVPVEFLPYIDGHLPRTAAQIGRMLQIDTKWDTSLKAIFCMHERNSLRVHSLILEQLRSLFTEASEVAQPLLSVKVAGYALPAGIKGGLLLVAKCCPVDAGRFFGEISAVSSREVVAGKAAINLVRWIENKRGQLGGSSGQVDAFVAAVHAFEQFRLGKVSEYVKGSGSMSDPVVRDYLAQAGVQSIRND